MPYRAKKSLGQNFLTDPNFVRKIIQSIGEENPSFILEIGPGRGALTAKLLNEKRRLILVEKDSELAALHRDFFKGHDNIEVFEEDFMDWDLPKYLNQEKGVAVGNLPYNVASQILIRLLENRSHFSQLFLMFQKEMALRFTAKPSTKDYGLMSLWAQIYSKPKILFHIPPTAFSPRPKIFSSFVSFEILSTPLLKKEEEDFFWPTIRHVFSQRRKTIVSVLKKTYPQVEETLASLGFDRNTRAETLSPVQLIKIVAALK